MQCRTSGNGDLPLHSLSKDIGFGLLGEHRGASAKGDVARTKRVLCGHRRERKTAFAKVLPKLWIVTCDRDGSIARGNYHQGGNARRQVLAKTQLPHLDWVGATLGTNSVRCDDLSKGKDLKHLLPKADRVFNLPRQHHARPAAAYLRRTPLTSRWLQSSHSNV
jgi:hypothetical protein